MVDKKEVKKQKQYNKGRNIEISLESLAKLKALKIHHRQSYAEVVDELLKGK